MGNKVIGDRIRQRRQQIGLTLNDIAIEIGVAKSTIQRYESGDIEKLKLPVIEAIARVLSVSPSWLCGKSDDMFEDYSQKDSSILFTLGIDNILPIETKCFPMLGNIACGEPIFASEGFDAYIEAGASINADFCLKAKGDSMTGARICDGDIVFIRKQDMVEDGEIAAVLIDDEATLKRVFYDREANVISLFAENPSYTTMRFTGEQLNRIRILGKAVAFQSDVK